MKELSIEEKARRYDEAIDKFDVILNLSTVKESGTIFVDDVRKIFPELKESEDERIRKDIVTYLKSILSNKKYGDKFIESWISWLEKQQKYVDKIQLGKKYKCVASPRYSTFMIGKIYKPEDKFLCSLMNFCSDCFEPIEYEQKPTIEMKSAEESLGIDSETYNKIVDECIYDEQKPADNIEKPWSEEDEARFESCIKLLQTSDGYDTINTKWLKSIKDKYTWKPSEEQLKSLKEVIDVGHFTSYPNALEILYEQLKKLRRE